MHVQATEVLVGYLSSPAYSTNSTPFSLIGAQTALDVVNADASILPGISLRLYSNFTGGDSSTGAMQALHQKSIGVEAIIGARRSGVSKSISDAVRMSDNLIFHMFLANFSHPLSQKCPII